MSERVGDFIRKHRNAELIAGATLVAGAAAVLGVREVRKRRRNRNEDEALMSDLTKEEMLARLEALRDPSLEPKEREQLMTTAARIYLATYNTGSDVITVDALLERSGMERFTLHGVLDYLEDSQLIARRPSSADASQIGYFAEAPLSWAVADDDDNNVPELQEAMSRIVSEPQTS